jgi:hypothetical protein
MKQAAHCECGNKTTLGSGKKIYGMHECECPWPEPVNVEPPAVHSIDWLGRWLVEKGTTSFYLCNNGWHIFKTCGDSQEDDKNARELCALLNERQRPNK